LLLACQTSARGVGEVTASSSGMADLQINGEIFTFEQGYFLSKMYAISRMLN